MALCCPPTATPHELWYENADSIKAKTALIAQHKLAGLPTWALGLEDGSFGQAALAAL